MLLVSVAHTAKIGSPACCDRTNDVPLKLSSVPWLPTIATDDALPDVMPRSVVPTGVCIAVHAAPLKWYVRPFGAVIHTSVDELPPTDSRKCAGPGRVTALHVTPS